VAVTTKTGRLVMAPPMKAAPFGLINSQTLAPDGERWEGGVAFPSVACAADVQIWDICSPVNGQVVTPADPDQWAVYGPPVGVTAEYACGTGQTAVDRVAAEARVLEILEATTQRALEHELRWGVVASAATPTGRWLQQPTTVEVTPATLGASASGVNYANGKATPKAGVGMLEEAYQQCSYGDTGVLHLTRGTAAQVTLEPDGDVLRTPSGTLVIVGTGYSSPDAGSAPWDTQNIAFITGPPRVWLGEPIVYPPVFDRSVNDVVIKAERMAAVTFDGCCSFGIGIDLVLGN
jgi:hypothetical protein